MFKPMNFISSSVTAYFLKKRLFHIQIGEQSRSYQYSNSDTFTFSAKNIIC